MSANSHFVFCFCFCKRFVVSQLSFSCLLDHNSQLCSHGSLLITCSNLGSGGATQNKTLQALSTKRSACFPPLGYISTACSCVRSSCKASPRVPSNWVARHVRSSTFLQKDGISRAPNPVTRVLRVPIEVQVPSLKTFKPGLAPLSVVSGDGPCVPHPAAAKDCMVLPR